MRGAIDFAFVRVERNTFTDLVTTVSSTLEAAHTRKQRKERKKKSDETHDSEKQRLQSGL